MSSSPSNSVTIFKFRKQEFPVEVIQEEEHDCEQDISEGEEPINVMCIICKHGKVGAAYYNFQEKSLNVYQEMLDLAPHYLSTMNLYREVKPKYILSFGNIADDFVKVLIDLITARPESTISSDSIRSLPENLVLLPIKEYSFEICKIIVSQLDLACNKDEPSEIKKKVYIHSLINFEYKLSIQAVGSVIKYLEKNWAFFEIEKEDLQYLHINQVSRNDHVLIDNSTFRALQVFSQRGHDASFKRGLQSSSREGLSIFKLFSANCKSRIGIVILKNILVNPLNNIDTLNKRLDFIDFALKTGNRDFIESLQDNMKHLGSDINTIYHTIFINDMSAPYRAKSTLLMELNEAVSPDLIGLENSIVNGLDFSTSQNRGRPVIRFGLDENLDAKKLRQQDISKDVTAAARFAANNLPDFLDECAVVYLPEMGHLIAIKEWEPDCNPEQLEDLGFQFMRNYSLQNPLCVELDKRLGDINAEIIDHENRILRRLSSFILKHNKDIREPLKIIGLMDSLISMAAAAAQNMYVRPKLNEENIFEIEEGKHPLMEHMLNQFQPNDFYSGGKYSHMKIITGPNGSGKSMYLKQIALIVFLAHIGSYVPAKSANIGLLTSMHSRMQTTESAAVRLSSFMIDLTQITLALNNATPASLILMDEFGRGTTEEDGISILVGVLKKFVDFNRNCPHVLVSTHFQQIVSHLPESPLIEYQKMEHTKENGVLCFLYKIAEGVSNSYAFDIAESIGIDKDVLDRAKYIMDCLKNNREIQPLEQNKRQSFDYDNLTQLNIPEPDEE